MQESNETYSNTQKIGGIIVLIAVIYLIIKIMKYKQADSEFLSPVTPFVLRSDTQGDGSYGASRGGRTHKGLDLVVAEGQEVRSPIDGVLVRRATPYADDLRWSGCLITNDRYEVKMFYMIPNNSKIGQKVKKGEVVGYAQNISLKYNDMMTPHLHVEIYDKILGQQNPADFLK